ncbi:hypothetical protein HY418_02710 [Candidatus Kaiserbacteria bacterium]|nr:hypothetical protein [Candidatus Kaiserbacteria bacterium]
MRFVKKEATMPFPTKLFTGTLSEVGNISNEEILARICASQIGRNDNWYQVAEALMAGRFDLSKLCFASNSGEVQEHQTRFIDALLMRGTLPPSRIALLAGMLAEAYVRPPD